MGQNGVGVSWLGSGWGFLGPSRDQESWPQWGSAGVGEVGCEGSHCPHRFQVYVGLGSLGGSPWSKEWVWGPGWVLGSRGWGGPKAGVRGLGWVDVRVGSLAQGWPAVPVGSLDQGSVVPGWI